MVVCTVFAWPMAFGAYYTGALTHLFVAKDPLTHLPRDPEMAKLIASKAADKFDKLVPTFLNNQTPPAISMVILLLVFSASMSQPLVACAGFKFSDRDGPLLRHH